MKSTSSMNQKSFLNQTADANDILENFDFHEIEEKDPSLNDGHKMLYKNKLFKIN